MTYASTSTSKYFDKSSGTRSLYASYIQISFALQNK